MLNDSLLRDFKRKIELCNYIIEGETISENDEREMLDLLYQLRCNIACRIAYTSQFESLPPNPTDHRAASDDVAKPDSDDTRSGVFGCSTAGDKS